MVITTPQQAILVLQDIIDRVEQIPVDLRTMDVFKLGDDVTAIMQDDLDLYTYAKTFVQGPIGATFAMNPVAGLNTALADLKANPGSFNWGNLAALLVQLVQTLLPLLIPQKVTA